MFVVSKVDVIHYSFLIIALNRPMNYPFGSPSPTRSPTGEQRSPIFSIHTHDSPPTVARAPTNLFGMKMFKIPNMKTWI